MESDLLFWVRIGSGVVAFFLLVSVVREIWLVNVIRRWKKIAQCCGVKQLHELPDGEYQLCRIYATVGRWKPWRLYTFFDVTGPQQKRVTVLTLGVCPPSAFAIKDGKICEPSHEMLADLRKEQGGEKPTGSLKNP